MTATPQKWLEKIMASYAWICSQQVTRLICTFISSLQLLFWTTRKAVISPQPFSSLNRQAQPPRNSLGKSRPPKKANPEKRAFRGWGEERGVVWQIRVSRNLPPLRGDRASLIQEIFKWILCVRKKILSYPNKIRADYNYFFFFFKLALNKSS